MAGSWVTNQGNSGILLEPTLTSVTRFGWDRGCAQGHWVSGKDNPWKGGVGGDQFWEWGMEKSRSGIRKCNAQGPLPSLLTPLQMQKWGPWTLNHPYTCPSVGNTHHPCWAPGESWWPCRMLSLDGVLTPQPWGCAGVHPCCRQSPFLHSLSHRAPRGC